MAVDYSATIDYPNYCGINLISGQTIYISSQQDTTELSTTGQTFICRPNNTGITYADIDIVGTIWNHIGTFRKNFDFSRTDGRDADIEFLGIPGVEDKSPHAKVTIIDSTGTTTLTTNWAKATLGTPKSYYVCKLWLDGNKITYLSNHSTDMVLWVSGSITTSTQPCTVTIAVVKNSQTGTTFGDVSVTLDQNSRKFTWSTVIYVEDMVYGDYLELYCKGLGTDTIIFEDINMYMSSR